MGLGVPEIIILASHFISIIWVFIDSRKKKSSLLYILFPIFLGPLGLIIYFLRERK